MIVEVVVGGSTVLTITPFPAAFTTIAAFHTLQPSKPRMLPDRRHHFITTVDKENKTESAHPCFKMALVVLSIAK